MSLDLDSLPDDVEELKRIIIFQNIKHAQELKHQKQKEIEYQEELRLQRLKEEVFTN
ncbi:hypothetical protein [Leptospira alexanderi]|uniref:hypothetical protein n=1 Tax=Leptospira alexanderi TaxID=100053 RepID=UPI00148224F7|nr:hypothetical protein [Leptospira alexanderi]